MLLERLAILPLTLVLTVAAPRSSGQTTAAPNPVRDAQSESPKDPQALAVLANMVSALGGPNLRSQIADSTTVGTTTTFSSAGQDTASLVIKTKGVDEIRYERTEGDVTDLYVVDKGQGWYTIGPKVLRIPYSQSYREVIFHLPLLSMISGLPGADSRIEYLGVSVSGKTSVDSVAFIDESLTNPVTGGKKDKDVVQIAVDAATFLPVAIQIALQQDSVNGGTEIEEYDFSDYRSIQGVLVPFSIVQIIGGMKAAQITISDIKFNTGIPESDFQAANTTAY
jgi:hypothetical protein